VYIPKHSSELLIPLIYIMTVFAIEVWKVWSLELRFVGGIIAENDLIDNESPCKMVLS